MQATPLILTGFAVAFAFRCGLFNIGGKGQSGSDPCARCSSPSTSAASPGWSLATVAARHRRRSLGGLAGGLKAYRGAHEVITTIMLNFIAIYTAQYFFGVGGPLRTTRVGNAVSANIKASAQYPGTWGVVQHIHIGIFDRARAAPSSTT